MTNQLFEPHLWNISSLFSKIYNIPVYQRPYSWGKEEIETLFNDIYDGFCNYDKGDDSPNKKFDFYTGNIIIQTKNNINGLVDIFEVVDGQQRIITFTLLLMSIYIKLLGQKNCDQTRKDIENSLVKVTDDEKKYNAITLNSIDKEALEAIYEEFKTSPIRLVEFCKDRINNNSISSCEKKVYDNFYFINSLVEKTFSICETIDVEKIKEFKKYIYAYVKFIVIETNCSENQIFSIFLSLNSKGKKLDNIDIIKCYIFSEIEEKYHSKYLKIWGELIEKTNDNLYDYLYTYIKSYFCYYRQNINVENFKTVCNLDLAKKYFKTNDNKEIIRKILEDMLKKVEYYNMLFNINLIPNLTYCGKFYYKIFIDLKYIHPKALFMRLFYEYNQGNISKDDLSEIISNITIYMIKFLTIGSKDSKDAITFFVEIMNYIYNNNIIDKKFIIEKIRIELKTKGISNDSIKNEIIGMNAYEKKNITNALLSLYEAYQENSNTYYERALNIYTQSKSLDHILPQTPEIDFVDFDYYNKDNKLIINENSDFPEDIYNEMEYDIFKKTILNKLGNLRIIERTLNASINNKPKEIEGKIMKKYVDIKNRQENITNTLVKILE